MKIRDLPPKISKLLGYYDKNIQKRYELGCVGKTELACYNRFVDDLEKSESESYPYHFDEKSIAKMMKFASLLTVYAENGKPDRLDLWPIQRFMVSQIYGWRRKDSKLLRYRESYIQIARRNGKSFTSSFLGIYFMMLSPYRSERGIIFSVKLDTAMIAFRQYCAFLDADSDLGDLFKYSKVNGNSSCLGTDNYLEVFSGAKDQDGFSSGWALADELGLQDGELYQLILDGQANFSSAQLIGITTASFLLNGFCHNKYKALRKQLFAHNLDDTHFVCICEPDDDDDISDWHTWAKANPVLFFDREGNIRQDKVDLYQIKYQAAVRAGGKQMTSFITKQINRWCVESDALVCNFDDLQRSRFLFSFQDVLDRYKIWYLGVDLAQVLDLNSVAFATWINVSADGKLLDFEDNSGFQRLYVNVISFIPAATLTRHINSDKFRYDNYLNSEIFLTVGGKGQRTDYGEILAKINEIREQNELTYKTIACDPYGVATIQQGLDDICDSLIMQSQSHKALSQYVEQFGTIVSGDELAISDGSCDIFMKAITNSVVSTDKDGYAFISKPTVDSNTNYRIDPLDATIDAIIAPLIDRQRDELTTDQAVDLWASLYN